MPHLPLCLAAALALAPPQGRDYGGAVEPEPSTASAEVAPTGAGPADGGDTDPGAGQGGEDDPLADDPLADDEVDEAIEDVAVADDYDPLRDSPEARTAAGWVRSGIIFTAVGGLLVIGAVAMSFTEACDFSAGNGCQESARLRASLAMGVPGGALVGGGAAMLVVGKLQQRRLRAAPVALRRGGGLALSLQF
ncbi:MAG: hypothetical protein H6710_14820 [Myxococcales bacterium]|nr:hypothetical protein [Myxococcales bacterium]MCB9702052.1 hypothetical protein [Myxococcales bacterium]